MPAKCAIVGCGTHRATNTVLSFFKIRQRKYPEWQQALWAAINQYDRNVDINRATICSRHFTPDCIKEHMCGRSTLLPGSLPTLWMPAKSVETPKPPRKALAVTDLGTSTNQLSTGMEPNKSAMAGLKLEFDIAEDPQGNYAYTDDARKSRGPDHSGSNYAKVSEQPSGAGFEMFGLKVEMNTKTPDPDLAEAEDPFTAVNIQVKKEPVSDSGDDTSHDDTESRGPDHAEVSEKPSGAGFGMFGLKVKLKTETPDPDMTEAEDPFTALNLQVKKEPVSDSGDNTSDDDTEGYDASDTDWHVTFSNSDPNFDDGDSNMNNRKENNKGLIENQASKATHSSTKSSAASSKDTVCYNSSVIKPRMLLSMEKKFSCQLCSSAFVKFSSLKIHMSSYHGQKYHKALAQHTGETLAGERSLATKPSLEELTAKTQSQIVSPCGKKRQQHFDEKDTLKEFSDHQEILNKRLKCNFCDRAFSSTQYLKAHQRIHMGDKPYQCMDCGKVCCLSIHLKTHQRIHTGEKPYQCMDCGKAFSLLINLKTHQRLHTGDKPFKCKDCDKAFSRSGNLKSHRLVHTGDKPYQCTECDKAFSRSHILKTHQRIHTGDKPYHCPDCNKAFSRSDDLKAHQHIHIGDKPFQCTDCGKAFLRSHHLKRHQRIHTGDKAFSRSDDLKVPQRVHIGDKPFQCTDVST